MEGHRSCTAWASFSPSIVPGIWMSEKRSDISERDSRMESASSALTASTALKPASSTISTARIRSTISSSTTRTFGGIEADVMTGLFPWEGKLLDQQHDLVEACGDE